MKMQLAPRREKSGNTARQKCEKQKQGTYMEESQALDREP